MCTEFRNWAILVPSNPCKAHLPYAHWYQLLKSNFMLFYLTPLSYSLSILLRWKVRKRKELLHCFGCVLKSWFENRVGLIIRIIHFLSTNTRVSFSLWSGPGFFFFFILGEHTVKFWGWEAGRGREISSSRRVLSHSFQENLHVCALLEGAGSTNGSVGKPPLQAMTK